MIKRMVVSVALLFAVLLLMLPRSDERSQNKMISAAMLMCSQPYRELVAEEIRRGHQEYPPFNNSCPELISRIDLDDQGAMLLTNTKQRLTLSLTASLLGDGKVHWSCRGEPSAEITSLCKP